MRVLILSDGAGWIIDRITNIMISKIPCEFTRASFGSAPPNFVDLANEHDLVHCQNVVDTIDPSYFEQITTPVLMSVRSHRYNKSIAAALLPRIDAVHVVSPYLIEEFPRAYYIPDGIMDEFMKPKSFVVGFAGRPDDYKGYHLIRAACEAEGVEFRPAINLHPDQMLDYYKSINLYVCASINEGHSTPVMECMAMNIPVITTDVGVPRGLNVRKVDRSVAAIRHGIRRYNSQCQVREFSWDRICKQFHKLYEDLA